MPRGYRRIVIAAFGSLILVAVGAGADRASIWINSPDSYPSYQNAENEHSDAGPIIAPRNPSKSSEKRQPCRNQRGRDESELCANWRSADATEKAARWAWVQMFLSALGVMGLGTTLWFNLEAWRQAESSKGETARALRASEAAAASAARQADITETTARQTLQAYMAYQQTIITRHRDPHTGHWERLHFAVGWINVGRTPAGVIKAGASVVLTNDAIPVMPINFVDTPGAKAFPNSQVKLSSSDITRKDVEDIINNRVNCFVYSMFQFSNIYGEVVTESVCIRVRLGPLALSSDRSDILDGSCLFEIVTNYDVAIAPASAQG